MGMFGDLDSLLGGLSKPLNYQGESFLGGRDRVGTVSCLLPIPTDTGQWKDQEYMLSFCFFCIGVVVLLWLGCLSHIGIQCPMWLYEEMRLLRMIKS